MAKDKPRKAAAAKERAPDMPARNWFDFHPRITLMALLLVLLAIFYHSLIFEGQTFGTPDSYAPAGFSKVGQQAIDKDHVYPLWNPYIFCGMPSFSSLSFNPYIYPPDWPFALLGKVVRLWPSFLILLYALLAGFFMALLLLEIGLPIMSSLWGALVFSYTPNFVAMGAYGHGSKVATVAYIPLVLWLAERLFKRWRAQDFGWLALALGCQILRAHIQIVYYTAMMMGLYFLVHAASLIKAGARATKILRDGAGLVGAYVLAAALAAFLLLPVKSYQKYSVRGASEEGGATLAYATNWSFGPSEIATFFIPSATGFGGATYVGSVKPFTDYPNYMGLLALFLAGAGFILVRDRLSIFAALLALLSLLISFGAYFKPLYEFLFHHLPFFNAFRVPVMILILLQFAVALLSARGIYALVGRLTVADRGVMVKRLWLLAAGAAAVAVLLALAVPGWLGSYQTHLKAAQPQMPAGSLDFLTQNARHHFLDDLFKVWGVLALGLAALALLGQGKLPRNAFWAVVMALLVFDLWRVDNRIITPPADEISAGLRSSLLVPASELDQTVSEEDDATRFLKNDPELYRIMPLDDFTTNRYVGFGIASIGGYNPAKPKLYDDLVQSQTVSQPRFWMASNLKYIVTSRDMGPGFVQPVPGMSQPLIGRKVLDGAQKIYQLDPHGPRAWMVGTARVARGQGGAAIYQDSTYDPSREVVLDQLPAGALGPQEKSQVRFSHWSLNDMSMDVDAQSNGYLVVSELYYPDWKATLDGRSVPILKADGFARAVAVPGGRHKVAMRFESAALRQGLRLSLAAAVIILALLLLPLIWGAKRRPAAAGART